MQNQKSDIPFFALIAANLFLVFLLLRSNDIKAPVVEEEIKSITVQKSIKSYQNDDAEYHFSNAGLSKTILKKYKQTVESEQGFEILSEQNLVGITWRGNTQLPDSKTKWKISKQQNKMIFSWKNDENVEFKQIWEMNENYEVNLSIKITNNSESEIEVIPEIIITKEVEEDKQGSTFSGITTFFNDSMKNYKVKKADNINIKASKGWATFNERFWLIALKSDDFSSIKLNNKNSHQINMKMKPIMLNSNETYNSTHTMFIGPKNLNYLQNFDKKHNTNLEYTLDYGMFFFVIKPLNTLFEKVITLIKTKKIDEKLNISAAAIALILFTIFFRLISLRSTRKQHISSKIMASLKPQTEAIQEKFKHMPLVAQTEVNLLYKKHGVSMGAMILPAIFSMLLLFPFYKVLSFNIELRFEYFPFWIKDLSHADPTSFMNLFGLAPWNAPEFLQIGAWPILMGLTMLAQSSFSADNSTKSISLFMAVIFTFMFAQASSGALIYWTLSSFMTVIQLYFLDRNLK